jgi:hypothetical protein
MTKYKILALLLPVVFGMTALMAVPKQEQISGSRSKPRKTDISHFPIAEFASSETKDAKRKARAEKRNKSHWRVDPNSVSDSTVRVDSIDFSSPAFPIKEAQAVIVGTVSDAKAYLSNDKTGVYSVFSVLIEEVLKHSGKLTVGSAIEAEREGGRVKFPSGRTHLYMISEQDMPRVGGRYVLFLSETNTENVFEVITGYEICSDSVSPLDELPQARAYENATPATLLNELKTKLGRP